MGVKISDKGKKIRVNITVDKALLEQAKTKLGLFGGKLSTLFNAYLNDFVDSIDKKGGEEKKELIRKIDELEKRINRIENSKQT